MISLINSIKVCPICGRGMTESEDSEYFLCSNCRVVRSKYQYNPLQYNKAYAETYLQYAKSPVNQSLNLFRLGLISRWLSLEAKILDIGCGVGEFLRFAEKYYPCYGYEPNLEAAVKAHSRASRSMILPALNGNCDEFDCITMFDVIEHIEEPIGFVKRCYDLLKPNGIIAITTPNADAVSESDLTKWKHYKPKEHLFLHTMTSLEILFEKVGMKVKHWGWEESDIRPGNPNADLLTCVARKEVACETSQ